MLYPPPTRADSSQALPKSEKQVEFSSIQSVSNIEQGQIGRRVVREMLVVPLRSIAIQFRETESSVEQNSYFFDIWSPGPDRVN
jgi:hypothetical protein